MAGNYKVGGSNPPWSEALIYMKLGIVKVIFSIAYVTSYHVLYNTRTLLA